MSKHIESCIKCDVCQISASDIEAHNEQFRFCPEAKMPHDETAYRERHQFRSRPLRGSNPIWLFKGMAPRPPTFPENHAANVERYGKFSWEGSAWCHSCQSHIPKDQLIENPQPSDSYLDPACMLCAESIARSLPKCPACGQLCSSSEYPEGKFPRCDGCGRSGCGCLNFQNVPHTFGCWMSEEYDSYDLLCSDCFSRIEEEKDRWWPLKQHQTKPFREVWNGGKD
jgi:hypothetical protein